MKRSIFRVSRSAAVVSFWDLENDEYDIELKSKSKREETNKPKKIYIVVFPRGEENFLKGKIQSVIDIFMGSRYVIPPVQEIPEAVLKLCEKIDETYKVLVEIESNICNFLYQKMIPIDNPIKYDLYRLYFKKEESIRRVLSRFEKHDNFLDGEVWIREEKFNV